MSHEQKKTCEDFESLLVKKMAGELLPEERGSLEGHLGQCASCAAEEQALSRVWQEFDSLQVPEAPAELYEETRKTILGHLRSEKSLFPRAGKILLGGTWLLFIPFLDGLAMAEV
jgi:anti-sigma factor RsiW